MAHARPYLDGKQPGQVVKKLVELANEEGIDLFVVGLPRSMDGSEGSAARRARAFAQSLKVRSGRRVVLLDERLTTRQAHDRLSEVGLDERRRRQLVDSEAAALLLETFLAAEGRGRV